MSVQHTAQALWLEPLDVLFFRDGRPFGPATRASSGQPLPQTLAGAVCTALLAQAGCDFTQLAHAMRRSGESPAPFRERLAEAIRQAGGPEWVAEIEVRGPWLARCPNGHLARCEVLVPMPAVLHRPKGKRISDQQAGFVRLAPLAQGKSLPGWKPPRGSLRPLWPPSADPSEPAQGYLTPKGLQTFLRGGIPASPASPEDWVAPEKLFDYELRTGIRVEPDRLASQEGEIYTRRFLALRPTVGFYAEVRVPAQGAVAWDRLGTLHFGGEARRVAVRPLPKPFEWPRALPAGAQKPLLLLTTPGLFDEGWQPRCLLGFLAAAAVPGEVALSGWDLARGGPKPTRFAAAAGSVYFLESLPPHLPSLLSDHEDDRRQGWGHFAQGVWHDG